MLKTKYRINLKEGIREGMGQVSQAAFEAPCLELWGRKGCLRAGDWVVGAWRRWEPLALSFLSLSGGNCGVYSLRRNLQLAWPPSHAAFCYTHALSSHNKSTRPSSSYCVLPQYILQYCNFSYLPMDSDLLVIYWSEMQGDLNQSKLPWCSGRYIWSPEPMELVLSFWNNWEANHTEKHIYCSFAAKDFQEVEKTFSVAMYILLWNLKSYFHKYINLP